MVTYVHMHWLRSLSYLYWQGTKVQVYDINFNLILLLIPEKTGSLQSVIAFDCIDLEAWIFHTIKGTQDGGGGVCRELYPPHTTSNTKLVIPWYFRMCSLADPFCLVKIGHKFLFSPVLLHTTSSVTWYTRLIFNIIMYHQNLKAVVVFISQLLIGHNLLPPKATFHRNTFRKGFLTLYIWRFKFHDSRSTGSREMSEFVWHARLHWHRSLTNSIVFMKCLCLFSIICHSHC